MVLRRLLSGLLIALFVFTTTGGALAQDGGPIDPQVVGPQVGEAVTALAGTGFTYSGELKNGGSPVTATCDFQFGLFDALSGGVQQGSTQTVTSVSVAAGRFTVTLNAAGEFGARAFDGSARWLALAVKCPPEVSYTSLTPRQALTPAPLAFALPGLRTEQNATSPNVIGGYISNTVSAGATAATISGGGYAGFPNTVTANFGTVSGGFSNTVSSASAFIGGGNRNLASGLAATIAGGSGNRATLTNAFIGGGYYNVASGEFSVVGGGGAGTIILHGPNQATANASTIGGGAGNTASGAGAFIGGGGWNGVFVSGNTAAGTASVVAGGTGNVISSTASFGTITGGFSNTVSEASSFIGGGNRNVASGLAATIAGGSGNQATLTNAFIGGGYYNVASGEFSVVGGGGGGTIILHGPNQATANASTIGGGAGNTASGAGAFIGGGGWDGSAIDGNTAAGAASVIGGGADNTTSSFYTTVSGGFSNDATGGSAAIGGGSNNTASDQYAVVSGGFGNTAGGYAATISGGNDNSAGGDGAVISGGSNQIASGDLATISGGYNNVVTTTASYGAIGGGITNTVNGLAAVVPGGQQNTAAGNYSFAAGYGSTAGFGSFVWTCATCSFTSSSANDQVVINALGGFWFGGRGAGSTTGPATAISTTQFISTTTGAYLSTVGVWTDVSDRNAKMNFAPVSVLDALMTLPVQSWQYKLDEANVRHIGPTAQDFYAAFGVGQDDTHLAALDTSGVALAAVQELATVVEAREAEIAALAARVDALEQGGGPAGPAPLTAALPWLLLAGLALLNVGGLAGYALAKRGGRRA